MPPLPKPTPQHAGWLLITIVAIGAILHLAQEVLVPVALAILLTFLLGPLVSRLERWGLPRGVAVALTVLLACALVGVIGYIVVHQFLGLIENLNLYRDNLIEKFRGVFGQPGNGLERSAEAVKELTEELQKTAPTQAESPDVEKVQVVEPPPNAMQVLSGVFGPLVAPASTAAIVVVFVIFMLLQREDLRDRLVRLFGTDDMHTTVLALDDAAARVSRYLMMQLLINGVQGAITAAGLWFIGVPEPLLWGALTVVLRFIPYLGPALAAAGPIVLSFAYFDGWSEPMMVMGLIGTLELISNNLLEPLLYGSSVGVSSAALIVATVFWTWLWGTVGLFLATPLTVCLVVMGKYIPQLQFLGVMLSDEPVLTPRERFYQRLLADDVDEAGDLLEEGLEKGSLAELADRVVLPALRLAEQDHDRGAIDEKRRNQIIERVGTLLDDLLDGAGAAAAAPAAPLQGAALKVLCLPAADRADEVAAELVSALLVHESIDARTLSIRTLKGEMMERVAEEQPDAICISAAPPAAVLHARYLCKRLRHRFPGTPVLVGLWDAQGDLQKAEERLRSVGAAVVVVSAAAALEETRRLLQPAIQGVRREPAPVVPV